MNPPTDPAGPYEAEARALRAFTEELLLMAADYGLLTTFTWVCPFGCRVEVVGGREQRHDCDGETVIGRGLAGYVPDEDDRRIAVRAVAERLKPMLRQRQFEVWRDGVSAGRRVTMPHPPTGGGIVGGPVGEAITTDADDPRLGVGVDEEPTGQNAAYLVLGPDQPPVRAHRPVRTSYKHVGGCGAVTTMNYAIAETYARDPGFYGSTYCSGCRMHRPVAEFEWVPKPGETIVPEQRRVGS